MNRQDKKLNGDANERRRILKLATSLGAITALSPFVGILGSAQAASNSSIKAFVYTELQISVPFSKVPWKELNKSISAQPGFINKNWFYGAENGSVGGIYAFDSIENAQKYVTEYFPTEARKLGVAQTTRIFDAVVTEEASRGMNSAYYTKQNSANPGAFVYTEVQLSVTFEKVPWQKRNPVLLQQKGLISKTWFSGLNTKTIGGVDVFDTVENAKDFALNDFPKVAKKLNAAFYTRVFDADVTKQASRQMHSPYYR